MARTPDNQPKGDLGCLIFVALGGAAFSLFCLATGLKLAIWVWTH